MKNPKHTFFLALCGLTFYFVSFISSAEVSGKVIAYACYSCHGEKLAKLNLNPPLSAPQLNKTLLMFKSNKKTSTIMGRITKGYSNNELKSVANYLSEED